MLVVGGGILLLLIALSALTFLSGPSKDRASVAKLAALNAEMARVSELALDSDAAKTPSLNLAVRAKILALNNQRDIVAYMSKAYGGGVTESEVKSVSNKEIDSFLLQAGERNTYEKDFAEVIRNLLEDANEAAASATALAKSEQLKTLMATVTEKNQTMIDGINAMELE